MKTINLIRHAKSDWSDENLDDFDRWLDEKWLKEIKHISKILDKLDFETELIICSEAKRAKLTYKWLKKEVKGIKKADIIFSKEIYDFHNAKINKTIEIIKNIDNNFDNVSIIWHNPAFEDLLNYFINSNNLHIWTLWVVSINFKIKDWKDLKWDWKMVLFLDSEV